MKVYTVSFVRLKLKAVGILLLIIFGMFNVLSFNVGNYGGTAFSATSESGDYEVVTLASGLSEPSFVAVDSKFVYFTEKGGLAIKKVPLYGGDAQTLATSLVGPVRLVVDSDYVYFTDVQNPGEGYIKKVPKGGGSVTVLASGFGWPFGLAIDDNYVYFADQLNGEILMVSKAGGSVITLASGLDGPRDLAVDDSYVYFSDYSSGTGTGSIKKVSKSGGTPTTLASGLTAPYYIALDEDYVYFAEYEGSYVKKVPKNGGSVTTLVISSNHCYTLAVDEDYVYFTEHIIQDYQVIGGNIKKVPKNGGTIEVLQENQNYPGGIAIDQNFLYYAEVSEGNIKKTSNGGDLIIEGIELIQVVRNAKALIKDKKTVIRVNITSTFKARVWVNITVTYDFGTKSYVETGPFSNGTPIDPGRNRIYVPCGPAKPAYDNNWQGEVKWLKWTKTGNDSLVSVSVDSEGNIPESDSNNNIAESSVKIVESYSIKFLVVPVYFPDIGQSSFKPSDDVINSQFKFLISTYPVEENKISWVISDPISFKGPPTEFIGHDFVLTSWLYLNVALDLEDLAKNSGYDRVVIVFDNDGLQIKDWAGYAPGMFKFAPPADPIPVFVLNSELEYQLSLIAHEIGHTFFLKHPHDPALLGGGPAIYLAEKYSPESNEYEELSRTFMSYWNRPPEGYSISEWLKLPIWIDKKRFDEDFLPLAIPALRRQNLFDSLTLETSQQTLSHQIYAQQSSTVSEVLTLSFLVFKNNTVKFDETCYRLSNIQPNYSEGIKGNYSIVLLDEKRRLLSRFPFNVTFQVLYEQNGTFAKENVECEPFVFDIPYLNDTRFIEIWDSQNKSLAIRVVSENGPVVNVVFPNGGEVLEAGKNYTISWEGYDADGDQLLYSVAYSPDNGQTWIPIAFEINQTSIIWDTTNAKESNQYLIKVIATDGVNTAEDTSNSTFIVNRGKYVPIRVPDDYPTIQEAINAADPNDKIIVKNGTYNENIVLNKTVSLIGESRQETIIDGKKGKVIEITANNVYLENFTIKNGNIGVHLSNSNGTIIKHVNVTKCETGIYIDKSYNSSLKNNQLNENNYSFRIEGVDIEHYLHDIDTSNWVENKPVYYLVNKHDLDISNNIGWIATVNSTNIRINNCKLTNNYHGALIMFSKNVTMEDIEIDKTVNGVIVKNSSYITIENTKITTEYEAILLEYVECSLIKRNVINSIRGIRLTSSNDNMITGNNMITVIGISLYSSFNNTIMGNKIQTPREDKLFAGIYADSSSNFNIIKRNILKRIHWGACLHSSYNIVLGNSIKNGDIGISIQAEGTHNDIVYNNIINCEWYGIHVFGTNNRIYNNNLFNSSVVAGEGTNTWDNGYPSGGNYYSNYNGTDNYSGPEQNIPGADGIGDSPYIINEYNIDNYPLMRPYTSTIVVPDDYPTIQDAIDAAIDGDTVYVKAGVYYEHLVINKSIQLIGENAETTIINGNGTGQVIEIDYPATECVIQNLTITGAVYSTPIQSQYGILVYEPVQIDNCIINNNDVGIGILAEYANVSNSIIYNNTYGIMVEGYGEIINNTINSNEYGIFVQADDGALVKDNEFINNEFGLKVWFVFATFKMQGNIFHENRYSLSLEGRSYTYYDIDLSNTINGKPVHIIRNAQNLIINSTFLSNTGYVAIFDSSNVIIEDATLPKNNGQGLILCNINNLTLRNIISEHNYEGIVLYDIVNGSVYANTIKNNQYGIKISNCKNLTLRLNQLQNNSRSFGIYGTSIEHFTTNDIQWSNLIDDNPTYYIKNQENVVISPSSHPNIGYLGVVNSTNVVISDLNLSANGQGLLLAYVNDFKIRNLTISNCWVGIQLNHVTKGELIMTEIVDSEYAMIIRASNFINITGCEITNNTIGASLSYPANNDVIVSENNFEDNILGVVIFPYSYDTKFFHNNFVDNSIQAILYSYGVDWDNGYPSGGNYWSDYNGTDHYNGVYQNIKGCDGIGDIPYAIEEYYQNVDRYPLMGPWTREGLNVEVPISDEYRLLFENVTSSGVTTLQELNEGPNPPTGFKLATQPPLYYNITTTAEYGGNILISIKYNDENLTEHEEKNLKLMQWNIDSWTDITTEVDIENNFIHGRTTHLSLFAIMTTTVLKHEIQVIDVSLSNPSPSVNESITISVKLANLGNYTETFTVLVNYTRLRDPIIGSQTITLAPRETAVLNFTWTPNMPGRYRILAYTSEIPEDIDPSNNRREITIYVRSQASTGGASSMGFRVCLLK